MNAMAFHVDFSKASGAIRPLHGVNFGPISFSGLIDHSAQFRKLKIPFVRLHDCHMAVPGTVDIHYLFPLFHADPRDPANFVFPATDDYIQSIKDVGSDVIFRLGESIEHYTRRKYFVHPPADFDKWAEICVQIIRHYNEGWANGFSHGIKYWEIWNEAFGKVLWTGTPEQFYKLYETAAKRIKAHDPSLKVGCGGAEYWVNFSEGLVNHCRATRTPLDFFVWHSYQHDPKKMMANGRGVRQRLDELGFAGTPIHLNEWAHNPDNDWGYLTEPEKKAGTLIPRMQGAEGAAYTATVLCWLQDFPVELAAYYWANNGLWGLFDDWGRPNRIYSAFEAFVQVLSLTQRSAATGTDEDTGQAVLASVSAEQGEAAILISRFAPIEADCALRLDNLPWEGPSTVETLVIDDKRMLESIKSERLSGRSATLSVHCRAPCVLLLKIRKAPPSAGQRLPQAMQ